MSDLDDAIALAAREHQLPVALLSAIVEVESTRDPFAWKVEPPYRYLWNLRTGAPFRTLTPAEIASERAPLDFPHLDISSRDTEWWGQQASWGPMQVMGAVAREFGFRGHFPALCGPLGIDYGARYLAALTERLLARYTWEGVVAAYNAGSPRRRADGQWENQEYVDRVRAAGGFVRVFASMHGTA